MKRFIITRQILTIFIRYSEFQNKVIKLFCSCFCNAIWYLANNRIFGKLVYYVENIFIIPPCTWRSTIKPIDTISNGLVGNFSNRVYIYSYFFHFGHKWICKLPTKSLTSFWVLDHWHHTKTVQVALLTSNVRPETDNVKTLRPHQANSSERQQVISPFLKSQKISTSTYEPSSALDSSSVVFQDNLVRSVRAFRENSLKLHLWCLSGTLIRLCQWTHNLNWTCKMHSGRTT